MAVDVLLGAYAMIAHLDRKATKPAALGLATAAILTASLGRRTSYR